jgi:hypothetical protein
MVLRSLALFAIAVSFSSFVTVPQGKGKAPPPLAGSVHKLDELQLTLTLPDSLGELKAQPIDPKSTQLRGAWNVALGEAHAKIYLFVMPNEEFGYEEPEDVSDVLLENFRDRTDKSFAYSNTELVEGSFGWAPYGAVAWGPIHDDAGAETGTFYMLGGLLEKHGYALQVIAEPKLDAAGEGAVLEMLRRGMAYAGKTRNAQWTDEEAKARWLAVAPQAIAKKFDKPLRTKHYIVLTNHNGPGNFLKKLEENYETIRKVYPFPEAQGRRLMPIYLFLTADSYWEFFANHFNTTVEEARKSAGVASSDFYATYYNDPGDPTHIHECTHQIFSNRLRLPGGGSWFQEGVAEYMSTKPNDRNDAARDVKKEKHTKLPQFIEIKSLLFSPKKDTKGENEASGHYELASLLIEFVRESKQFKDKFLAWVHAVGNVPRSNLVAVERATKATLGVDLKALETQWIEYCKKR